MGESLDDDALGGGAFGDGIGAHFAGLSPTGNVPLSPLGGGNGMGGSGFFSSNSPKSFADMSMNFDDPAAAMNGGGRNGFLPEMGAANDAPVLSAPPKVLIWRRRKEELSERGIVRPSCFLVALSASYFFSRSTSTEHTLCVNHPTCHDFNRSDVFFCMQLLRIR